MATFLSKAELITAIYEYQIDEITEGDDAIAEQAIEAAIDEVKSYLTPNRQIAFLDGRLLYDTEAIFSAIGTERNALILAHTKTIAKWWIILLSNPDIIYEQVKERYDRSVSYLRDLASGKATLGSLPTIDNSSTGGSDTEEEPFAFGSRRKFHHEGNRFDESPYYPQDNI